MSSWAKGVDVSCQILDLREGCNGLQDWLPDGTIRLQQGISHMAHSGNHLGEGQVLLSQLST